MRCLLFFPSSHSAKQNVSPAVDRTSVRYCSTKGSASQLLHLEASTVKHRLQSGFTLLELLVVITLLAIIAGAAVSGYGDVPEQARYDTTKFEMAEIKKALLQFRRDTRELPCRVYREGIYAPDNTGITLDFTNLPSSPTVENYHTWCRNNDLGQVDWGLTLLLTFPFDNTDIAYTSRLWNLDTKGGWHGPYVNNQGLKDGWGNRFVLLDPELDYSPHYRCKNNSGLYDVTGDLYSCLTADDTGWNVLTYTLPANIARLVSNGPDGNYNGVNTADPCLPKTDSDDLILCLLK